ncbi:hypothetical protein [Haematomicrobium sanguinis]|uniref:hypothetical protein n=1 Tax=Haematomicrobium sanguinis TaxID=479106 RepID=UPI000478E0F0|nr:hypothetical protein [Haematomicrobium sanguinis]
MVAAAAILAAINDEVTDQGIDWLVNTLNLEAVGEILSNVTAVLGVIAFIVSFIPGLNVLAPLLFALTFVLGALSLATNSLLAMNGNKDWGDAIMDAVGLATFGLGRVITVIGRGAAAMGRAGTSAARGGAGAARGGVPQFGAVTNGARNLGQEVSNAPGTVLELLGQAWARGRGNMWGEAFESAVNSGKGFWKAVSGGPQHFLQSFLNLFKGKPGFFKDMTELSEGLSTLSLRTEGGRQFLVMFVGGKALTFTVADFVKSGVIDPMAQFFGPKAPPQPQPAGN